MTNGITRSLMLSAASVALMGGALVAQPAMAAAAAIHGHFVDIRKFS